MRWNRRPWRYTVAVVAMASFALAACGSNEENGSVAEPDDGPTAEAPDDGPTETETDAAAQDSDSLEELYELAREEGSVVWYTPITGTEETDAVAAAFEEAYPGITVTAEGAPGQAILERLLTEQRTGRHDADVFTYPGSAPFQFELDDEGFLGEHSLSTADNYPSEFIVEGKAWPLWSYQIGAAYNPDLVTEEEIELLRTYEGWVDPTFEGRVAVLAPTGGSSMRSFFYWANQDDDLGWDWLERMAELNPVPLDGGAVVRDRVAAGEYAVGLNLISTHPARMVGTGAPIEWVSAEYSVATPTMTGIMANAPNPNAARLFTEWLFSEEGQIVIQEQIAVPSLHLSLSDEARESFPATQAEWYEPPSEVVQADEQLIAERADEFSTRWQEVFGG